MNGAFEIEADVTPDANGIAGIEISNNKRERTLIYFDMKQGKVVMDRTESGLTDFASRQFLTISSWLGTSSVQLKARSLPALPTPSTTRTISLWLPGLR